MNDPAAVFASKLQGQVQHKIDVVVSHDLCSVSLQFANLCLALCGIFLRRVCLVRCCITLLFGG